MKTMALALSLYLLLVAPVFATCATCICTLSSLGVVFGNYLPTAASPATGQVSVTCLLSLGSSASVAYSLAFSSGNGSYSNRQLSLGGSHLAYNLYTTSAGNIVWGDGTAGTGTVSDSYTLTLATVRNYQIYGSIPANQNVPAGSYADTITVTISY